MFANVVNSATKNTNTESKKINKKNSLRVNRSSTVKPSKSKTQISISRPKSSGKTLPIRQNPHLSSSLQRRPRKNKDSDEIIDVLQDQLNNLHKENDYLKTSFRMRSIGAKSKTDGNLSARKHSKTRRKRSKSPRSGKLQSSVSKKSNKRRVSSSEEREELSNMLLKLQERLGGPGSLDNVLKQDSASEEVLALRQQLKKRTADITILQSKYEHLLASFRAEKELQNEALSQVEDLKKRLAESMAQTRQLRREHQLQELQGEQVQYLQNIISQLQKENRILTEKTSSQWNSIFKGDQIEQQLKKVVADYNAQIQQLQAELEDRDELLKTQENRMEKHDNERKKHLNLIRSLENEKDKLTRNIEHQKKKTQHLQERLDEFCSDAAVDMDELERALELIRRQKDDPSRLSLMKKHRNTKLPETVPGLKKAVQELQVQIKELMIEVKHKDDALASQEQMNIEYKNQAVHAREQMTELKQRMQELNFKTSTHPSHSLNIPHDVDSMSVNSMFINSETDILDLSEQTNIISFRVVSATLQPQFVLLREAVDPITCITVDFPNADTVFSEFHGGLHPNYQLTCQFPCHVDGWFYRMLETRELIVEIRLQGNTVDELPPVIGVARIALNRLMKQTGNHIKIEGKAQFINNDMMSKDSQSGMNASSLALVGEFNYELRMLRQVELSTGSDMSRNQKILSSADFISTNRQESDNLLGNPMNKTPPLSPVSHGMTSITPLPGETDTLNPRPMINSNSNVDTSGNKKNITTLGAPPPLSSNNNITRIDEKEKIYTTSSVINNNKNNNNNNNNNNITTLGAPPPLAPNNNNNSNIKTNVNDSISGIGSTNKESTSTLPSSSKILSDFNPPEPIRATSEAFKKREEKVVNNNENNNNETLTPKLNVAATDIQRCIARLKVEEFKLDNIEYSFIDTAMIAECKDLFLDCELARHRLGDPDVLEFVLDFLVNKNVWGKLTQSDTFIELKFLRSTVHIGALLYESLSDEVLKQHFENARQKSKFEVFTIDMHNVKIPMEVFATAEIKLKTLASVKKFDAVPLEVTLYEPKLNPFNQSTNISSHISKAIGKVKLQIRWAFTMCSENEMFNTCSKLDVKSDLPNKPGHGITLQRKRSDTFSNSSLPIDRYKTAENPTYSDTHIPNKTTINTHSHVGDKSFPPPPVFNNNNSNNQPSSTSSFRNERKLPTNNSNNQPSSASSFRNDRTVPTNNNNNNQPSSASSFRNDRKLPTNNNNNNQPSSASSFRNDRTVPTNNNNNNQPSSASSFRNDRTVPTNNNNNNQPSSASSFRNDRTVPTNNNSNNQPSSASSFRNERKLPTNNSNNQPSSASSFRNDRTVPTNNNNTNQPSSASSFRNERKLPTNNNNNQPSSASSFRNERKLPTNNNNNNQPSSASSFRNDRTVPTNNNNSNNNKSSRIATVTVTKPPQDNDDDDDDFEI